MSDFVGRRGYMASRLAAQRDEVPGTDEDTVLIGVSREGFDEQGRGLDAALVPQDMLDAWKQRYRTCFGRFIEPESVSQCSKAPKSRDQGP